MSNLGWWKIALINGHNLKYEVHGVYADTEKNAKEAAFMAAGGNNFDHQVVSVKWEGE